MATLVVSRIASGAGRNAILTAAGLTLLGAASTIVYMWGRFEAHQLLGAFLYLMMYWSILITGPFTFFALFSGIIIGLARPVFGTVGGALAGAAVSSGIAAIGYWMWPVVIPGNVLTLALTALICAACGAWVGRMTIHQRSIR